MSNSCFQGGEAGFEIEPLPLGNGGGSGGGSGGGGGGSSRPSRGPGSDREQPSSSKRYSVRPAKGAGPDGSGRKSESDADGNKNDNNNKKKKWGGPPVAVILVWALLGLELAFDMLTSGIAVVSLTQKFDCCEETIDFQTGQGRALLGIIVPFFALVYFEIIVLVLSIRDYLSLSPKRRQIEAEKKREMSKSSSFKFLGHDVRQRLINFLLTFNPFFGFFVAYLLLHKSNQLECLLVMGLEVGSALLHFASVWMEGLMRGKMAFLWHVAIPTVPLIVTIVLVTSYMERGGVCYFVDSSYFKFDGCSMVCPDGTLPGEGGICASGAIANGTQYCPSLYNGTLGGGPDDDFCFFGISSNDTSFWSLFEDVVNE